LISLASNFLYQFIQVNIPDPELPLLRILFVIFQKNGSVILRPGMAKVGQQTRFRFASKHGLDSKNYSRGRR